MANLKLRIREVAKEHGMTIAAVAEKLSIKPASLSQGIYMQSFSLDKLGEIADILGVGVHELFESFKPSTSASAAAPGLGIVCPHCGKRMEVEVTIKVSQE